MTDRPRLSPTRIRPWIPPGGAPAAGLDSLRKAVPAELAARLRDLGQLRDVLLAAHLKVLGVMGGERTPLTGYLVPGADLAPRGVALDDATWRDLIGKVHEPVEVVEDAPAFDVVLDFSGAGMTGAVLDVAYVDAEDGLWLELRFRQDVIDHAHAERFAGYELRALELLATDPDASHDAKSLVEPDEYEYQMRAHSGADIPWHGKLFVELFEEQVRLRPDDLAASHGDVRWTYRDLNANANKVANSLLRRGLLAEDPVAVVMNRELNWVAAMLGVFKAGGVYMPVRPDFPPDRVAMQFERADCKFVLSSADAVHTANEALAGSVRDCPVSLVEDLLRDETDDTDPKSSIQPGQLAYIYFTSGSTGAPKGAMCEHAGMLNHLYMKIDDMELAEGEVVTQTASQCFDISLWQVIAPWLVGASTRIIDTETQLDVDWFLDEIAAGGIQVIQIVPAYLDVMTSHLAKHPRALGDLRTISVTGEALKLELVRRWFALYPQISLVNAYGATEVSDDTMHEVLTGLPERDFVTVGRPLRNVHVYVLDEKLRIAPLGAPGEIAFSGVAVGRGYINDEERTAHAFVEDPHRPGTRLYRTGDFGRWLPEGKIEFLGRRDEQVKVRGFRIEIGDIENKILGVPHVREAAVVIDGDSDTKTLVAFYSGAAELKAEDIRDHLATQLPEYMIPTYFHRLDSLPLTENGKVNKKLLTSLAGTLGHAGASYVAPVTDAERRLATAWAEVLGVPLERIGRRDNFFELGGTSLAAVRLVVNLDRQISLTQVVTNPVLEDLAACLVAAGTPDAGLVQRLSIGDFDATATLVCLPYAGGNAVNFQQLAKALQDKGIAVYAVELPGHDLVGGQDAPLQEVAEVAKAVHEEITGITGPILLWGHCAGAAFAVEIARLMEADGRPPLRIFVGALMLDAVPDLDAESARVSAMSNTEITALLRQDSAFVELDTLKPERMDVVGSAYRHDVCSTNQYLADIQQDGVKLATPLEVVVAADDRTTVGHQTRHSRWGSIADHVELRELGEGGHYFVRTRADEVARLVADACR
nr:MlcA [uncultured bacterium]